jgi:hypothetical protein
MVPGPMEWNDVVVLEKGEAALRAAEAGCLPRSESIRGGDVSLGGPALEPFYGLSLAMNSFRSAR